MVGSGAVLVVVDAKEGGDEIVGIVGTAAMPAIPTMGSTPIVGTAAAELTPRLPISVEPRGIPGRATPPGVIGDVGDDDAATLPVPEPHIPDNPEVSGIPEVADISDVAAVSDDIDVAAVAGAAVPIVVPPPSKVAVDPNICDGEVPTVEHAVPLPDNGIVPVTPVGSGLSPGDASSVAPRGMPVGDTVESIPSPSGEVAPIVGVGAAIPPTCAIATLQMKSAGRTAAIDEIRIGIPRSKAASIAIKVGC